MEHQTDANTGIEDAGTVPSTDDGGDLQPDIDYTGLVSTTEFKSVKTEKKPDSEDADTSEGAEQSTPKQDESKDKGFADHPRFKELIDEKNGLKAENTALKTQMSQIAERLSKLESPEQKPKEQPNKLQYQNVAGMKDEDIIDQFNENPVSFLSNFAKQVASETRDFVLSELQNERTANERKTFEQRSLETNQAFFESHPDGLKMLQDGSIKKFMADNPGHNPISAYHALTADNVFTKEQFDAELKKQTEKLLRELKAAGKQTPAAPGATTKTTAKEPVNKAKNRGDLKRSMLKTLLKAAS